MPLKVRKLSGNIDNGTSSCKHVHPHFASEKEDIESGNIELSSLIHETRKPLLNSDSLVSQTYCPNDASSKL